MKSAIYPAAVVLALSTGTGFAAEDALASRARAVLTNHCHRCHGREGSAKGGFAYVLDRDRLVARGKVVPGKPAESELFQRIEKGEMPPAKQQPRPGGEDLTVLRRWIEAGAPAAGPPVGPRSFLADDAVRRLILADLRSLDPGQRRFTRYLTLTHLYNAGRTEEELQTCRHAVAKLVNSLSWQPRIAMPQPVDPVWTILRLDLRHYQWPARAWDRLIAVYPYRSSDDADARALAAATNCELPHLRADWFVATASRPPLYHDLLQLPSSDRELERQLRVEVLANLQDENAARAGFNESGVSRNNRLIERHDAAYGAYWRSYDFSDNTERQNLFERPLGPLSGRNGFIHAGGELLFHLPNGLQGYLLVDGSGRRLDRAPIEIVSDPRRPDRTVETGLSCMSCHVRGLIPKADQVRAHVLKNLSAFAPADVATVKALYPPEATLRALLQEDVDRFVKALAKTGVRPDDAEPVSAVALQYEAPLDLAAAAAEAGLPADKFAVRLRESAALSRPLGSLLVKGGTVQRSTFQAAFADLPRDQGSTTAVAAVSAAAAFRPFAGHSGQVTCIAFSPDGGQAVSGSEDQTLRLWDATSGKELRCFIGHSDEVLCVAFAPDGRSILSGGSDRTVRLWDVATAKELRRFTGHTDRVASAAFSHDGRRILSGSWDHTVRLWDSDTGREMLCCTGHNETVACLVFSPDRRFFLSGGLDGSLRLWEADTGREARRFTGHVRGTHAVAFSADGRRIVSGGSDRSVRLWDAATGKELRCFADQPATVACVAFSPDGKRILSGSTQYQGGAAALRLWDADTGRELARFGSGSVWCVAFSPDGARALTGTSEKTLRLWQLTK